ncbi:MAG TPA: serine/threonine-protein kinase [Gemmatimonadales bacterium]|nr:serine/threonine-protein kinase [Gemmatimonadales bacterium]
MDLSSLQRRLQQALGQEFTVGPLLGEGGFAAVYRARDNTLNRDVAVKVLDVEQAPSAVAAERFLREAQVVARLEHPHIVPIYKVGRQQEIFYIIMRCIDGPSLRQLLEGQKRLPLGDAARIARQVADALAYAHSRDIVHRDIKPDNILLDKSGHVLVTDFGIAKAAQAAKEKKGAASAQLTSEGMIVGTPEYMSPEQASGDPLDGRSDIYSLGVVLYQMLGGSPPFEGTSSAAILAQILTESPEPIRQRRSDVPEEMAVVLERMMEKDRSKRFQMASEVSRALVGALPTAASDRVRVPLKRRLRLMFYKSLVGIGVAGCLLFIAFAGGAAAVAYYVFSKPPHIAARAPLPDSVSRMLRARRLVEPGDAAFYAFEPAGQEDTTLLVLTRLRTVVATPHGVRSYARDSVKRGLHLDLRSGLSFRLVIAAAAPVRLADTVYRNLSFRDMLQLRPELNATVTDSTPVARPRPKPPPPSARPHSRTRTHPRSRTRSRTTTRPR